MRFRAARVMLTLAWQADRRRTVVAFLLFAVQALFTALFALWLKQLLDAVAASDTRRALVAAVLLGASVAAQICLDYVGSRVRQALNERAHHLVEQRLIEIVGRTPTLEIHETPEHLTQLELLDSEGWEFGNVIPALLDLTSTAIRIVTVVLLLIAVHPVLLLLPLFGVPMLLLSKYTNGLYNLGNELAADSLRRATDLRELATTAPPAKEIRLFRLGDEIVERFHRALHEVRDIHVRLQIRGQAIGLGARIGFLIGYLGAILFVVDLALHGSASLGDVVLTAVLAGQVLGLVSGSAEKIQWALRTLTSAGRYVYLQDVADRAHARVDHCVVVPRRLDQGITIEHLTYVYPGGVTALADVSLQLPAGATVAVVGENGAGKTTLVKLLAGLYTPTTGRILLDDLDLSTIHPAVWRRTVSAGFQDHARFEFSVHETVGVGELSDASEPAPREDVRSALDRAGAGDLHDQLPDGLATQLGPGWPSGVDLSGGQWQKLAIGRAMVRRRPLLLLLDEPTAALDAETEHRLFERWTAAARDVREATGAVTVLVSHRFSTVRMADLIVVVDAGRIVETGSHDELIARGGLYAELYQLQAAAYR
ncbi:MAG TPA: ABC transporter ATP-binding protein [Actinopolymorphaceae bacterium]